MKIRQIEKNDAANVIISMCRAFKADPLYSYFIEDEKTRDEFLKLFMSFRLKYGIKHGKVFVSDDGKGVAIWIKPNHKMSPVNLIMCGGLKAMKSCTKSQRQRIMTFNNFPTKCAKNI